MMGTASARRFAREALRNGLPLAPTGDLRITERWTELVLYRDGARQVELVVLQPGVTVPRHKHLRCESADVSLAGTGVFEIAGRVLDFTHDGQRCGRRLFDVPRDTPHGGASGAGGAAYLSFQVWQGQPGFIADDWEDCP